MADHMKASQLNEMDTNVLFEKFTVDEIRQIEKKTRSDIERKKEDLRQMVGERYRDLIQAADTITDMKKSAQNVMNCLSSMQDYCKNLKQTHMVKGVAASQKPRLDSQKKREEARFYGIASQIKLLLDMPEKMWSSIDSRQYLQATQLFLLARHIHTSLQLDGQQSGKVLTWFPVLTRQWAAIGHFRGNILQGCRDTLTDASVSEKVIAECLASIMLLEDSTPRQVFNEFLLARTNAIQQLLHHTQQGESVKDQVCSVVRVIVTTIQQIHAVFYTDTENTSEVNVETNLLMKTLEGVTKDVHAGCSILSQGSSISMQYLPKSVLDYHPTLHSVLAPIAPENLQHNCQQWVSTCIATVKNGVGRLLGYVNSIKGLAYIRNAVWDQLNQDIEASVWGLICHRVLNHPISVWEKFLQPLVLSRIKAVIQSQFQSSLSLSKQNLARVLNELEDYQNSPSSRYECDLASFIWTESPNDIPVNTAWVPAASKTLSEGGGLMLKARAYTPAVQSLCTNFDNKIASMLEDTQHYLSPDDKMAAEPGPFNRYADDENIKTCLQTACEECVNKLLDHVKERLTDMKKLLSETTSMTNKTRIAVHCVLILGRLCSALGDLSVHMEQCMMGAHKEKVPDSGRGFSKKILGFFKGSSQQSDIPQWSGMKNSLKETSADAYKIWSSFISHHLVQQFSGALLHGGSSSLLSTTTRWDDIEIQEETEDGKTVKSSIRVPMQPSWRVQTLLYSLCNEINHVGGHAISRSVLLDLVQLTTDQLLDVYDRVLHQDNSSDSIPLTQNRALQVLFDFKFLTSILSRKDDTPANKKYLQRLHKITDTIESHIDPFDLDVFSPYLQKHLNRQSQRCAILFGALTSLDKHSSLTTARSHPAGHQEQHNVLPLSTNQNRFQLLPLSNQPSRSVLPQPQTISKMAAPVVQSDDPIPQPQLKESTSFYDKLGTMWFGGKNN